MEFRDLGPLRVEVDGIAVPLNGRRLESVLALLISNAGRVVTVDALVEAVWGDTAPGRAAQSLESLIWRLRKVLEPGRAARQAATVLQTDDLGYRLAIEPAAVDSHRLIAAVDTVTRLLSSGQAETAAQVAGETLALWRAEPYQGVPDAQWIPAVRARLDEARLALQQQHVQALLDVDRPERALSELVGMLASQPHREEFWAHRMLALYRSGRQAEALATFAEARAMLADELGIDPGPRLQELHRRILAQDRRLDPSVPEVGPDRPMRLPRRAGTLVGRTAELDRLREQLSAPGLSTLTGPGGTGKTRLAVEAAHAEPDAHPDGAWFVDLADVTDSAAVWPRIASAIGLAAQPGATAEQITLGFLDRRAALLVLDNCEQVLDGARGAVDATLDTCPALTVLATSREPLDLSGEQVLPVPPLAVPTGPDVMATSPAVTLFLQRREAGDIDLDGPDGAAVARICAAVDGLPLGLELAAARARTFELAEVAHALERDPAELAKPGGGPQRHSRLHDTVDWSYRLARGPEQVLHRRLSVIAGPVTLPAARMLCAVPPLHPEQTMDLLAGLVHRSLCSAVPGERANSPSAFRQLVPIRAHARTSLAGSGETDTVERARDRWVVAHVLDAPNNGRPGQADWYDWLEDNTAALRATLTATVLERPSAVGARLAQSLVLYWYDRGLFVENMRWLAAAMDISDLDPFEACCARAAYCCALAVNLEPDRAQPLLRDTVPVLAAAPPEQAQRAADLLVLAAAALWAGDLWADADVAARAALQLGRQVGDEHVALCARSLLIAGDLVNGVPDRAVRDAEAVLVENHRVDNSFAALFACITLGLAALFAGDAEAGLHWTEQILRRQQRLGVRNVGDSLEHRGAHLVNAGRFDVAARCYGAASAMSEREGRPWPHHPGTPDAIDRLRAAISAADLERNWASGQRLGRDSTNVDLADWL